MGKRLWRSIAVLGALSSPVASSTGAQLSAFPTCRHDRAEQDDDRVRREQALALAKAINEAEGRAAERTRVYVPLSALRHIPAAPRGFDVRLYTDGSGYVLSIKDTLDPCRYGIFSDEAGIVYEKTPLPAPLVAHAARRR